MMEAFLRNTLELALLSAPWLLAGLLAAGLIRAWLPMELVGRSLGGRGPGAVTRAALIGAPLPLCSCGTLPAALALRRSGASKASTTAFLIATPETGVDSVAISWVMLGPFLAILRPLVAIVSAVTAGLLVGRTERETGPPLPAVGLPVTTAGPCGGGSCCTETAPAAAAAKTPGPLGRTLEGLRYAFTDLWDDLVPWLVVGIAAAGLVLTLAPPGLLAEWGSGLPAMLLIMLISVPMYVCATASTPLALAMLYAGVSPGTVLVFLLAGPASNLAGIILVRRELGGRALAAYLAGVGGISLLAGLGLDAAMDYGHWDLLAGMARPGAGEQELPFMLQLFSLLVLLVAAVKPFRRYLVRGKASEDGGCCG
ncbi:MAG TPA: permease [Sedimenticola sp.]|nr:permease [Sedimenticola sp.]